MQSKTEPPCGAGRLGSLARTIPGGLQATQATLPPLGVSERLASQPLPAAPKHAHAMLGVVLRVLLRLPQRRGLAAAAATGGREARSSRYSGGWAQPRL